MGKELGFLIEAIEPLQQRGAVGLKVEYEDEGALPEDVIRLGSVARQLGLSLTVKVGGCGAITDMRLADGAGADRIVAPMIESPFAMRKFLSATREVWPVMMGPRLAVNIETASAVREIQGLLAEDEENEVGEIVLGRVDLTASLGLSRVDAESETIFNLARTVVRTAQASGRGALLGGAVTGKSIVFIRNLLDDGLTGFETRLLVFSREAIQKHLDVDLIDQAVAAEIAWLSLRKQYHSSIAADHERRLTMLRARRTK